MALTGWLIDKRAAARIDDPLVRPRLTELAGSLHICPIGELEQLYSARSALEYDVWRDKLRAAYTLVSAPDDVWNVPSASSVISPTTTGCGTASPCQTCSSPRPHCTTASASCTSTPTSSASPRSAR